MRPNFHAPKVLRGAVWAVCRFWRGSLQQIAKITAAAAYTPGTPRAGREKELDEYERLLFGEDDAETVEPEEAAAEDETDAE